jgi:hypothetical protein
VVVLMWVLHSCWREVEVQLLLGVYLQQPQGPQETLVLPAASARPGKSQRCYAFEALLLAELVEELLWL